MKYVKAMDELKTKENIYKLNEKNVATDWNPFADNNLDYGGYSYTNEESVIRWLYKGNYVYEVTIPDGADTVKLSDSVDLFRTNEIIINNPQVVDDSLAMHYYRISNLPIRGYYKAIASSAVMGYKETALQIIHDKVNKYNVDEVLSDWKSFMNQKSQYTIKDINIVIEVENKLKSIKGN